MSEWVMAECAERGFDMMIIGGRAPVARGLLDQYFPAQRPWFAAALQRELNSAPS